MCGRRTRHLDRRRLRCSKNKRARRSAGTSLEGTGVVGKNAKGTGTALAVSEKCDSAQPRNGRRAGHRGRGNIFGARSKLNKLQSVVRAEVPASPRRRDQIRSNKTGGGRNEAGKKSLAG